MQSFRKFYISQGFPQKFRERGGAVFDFLIYLIFDPAGRCVELTDLMPTSFFREIVIVLLKMHAAGEIIGKICLKAR